VPPGLLLHDLRRTGVRNLCRLGVAESVAMRVSGHKRAAAFRRYDITDKADLAEAAKLLDAKARLAENQFGQSLAVVEAVDGQNVSKPVN